MNFKIMNSGLNFDIKADSIQEINIVLIADISDEKSYQLKSFLVRDISTVPEVFEKIIQIPAGGEHQCRLVA